MAAERNNPPIAQILIDAIRRMAVNAQDAAEKSRELGDQSGADEKTDFATKIYNLVYYLKRDKNGEKDI